MDGTGTGHAGPADLVLAGYVEAERERIVASLCEWLRIPSISAQPAHAADVVASAEWTASLLAEAGLHNVELIHPPGTTSAPAVYADHLHAGPDAPTVLVYGHHDVQPVDPLAEWTTPPFDPRVEGDLATGVVRGRGAVDDKGQVLFQVEAVRGLLAASGGTLPVNLRFLVEGEEEVGSPHFEGLLEAEHHRLACDAVVVSDTDMWSASVPSTCLGMRGMVGFEVFLRTAASDLHSGLFGGAVPNAAHHAARLVAALHDGGGRVTVPGFYDDVRPLTAAEVESMAAIPVDEDAWRRMASAGLLEGEAGRTLLERIWTRPTCDVVGIGTGYQGEGLKTVIPATATVKVTFRLVPDQRPGDVAEAFEAWVSAQVAEGVQATVTHLGAFNPALTPAAHPGVGAVCRAIERVWGRRPVLTRIGGSGPEEALGRVLGAPVLYLGVALPDDGFHAPNERMELDQLWKGVLAAGELFGELGRLGRAGLAAPPGAP